VKILQEKRGNTLNHIGIANHFLNRTPTAQQLRERSGKWNCIKLKLFQSKRNSHKTEEIAEWEKIFASYTSHKGLITRIYRELKN
jgi:hypothetical protein